MTALAPEALTTEEIVELARKQMAAFNSGDWEQLRAGLAPDSCYDELGTQRKIDGPEKIVELFKGWKAAFPDVVGTVTSAIASAGNDLEGHAYRPACNRGRNDPGLGQDPGDARCHLLHFRGQQGQGEPPVLRLDDSPQADRRATQVARQSNKDERGRPPRRPPSRTSWLPALAEPIRSRAG
jgi:SnoaL-like domain